MKHLLVALALLSFSLQATIEESILPAMEAVYTQDFGHKINRVQRQQMQNVLQKKAQKLRVMSYNMLYNAPDAEKNCLQSIAGTRGALEL